MPAFLTPYLPLQCTYLRTCVGRRTYTSFISFLIFTFLSLIYSIVWSAIHLYLLTRRQEQRLSFGDALGKNVGSAVSFVLGCLILLPLGALMLYHVRVSGRVSYNAKRYP